MVDLSRWDTGAGYDDIKHTTQTEGARADVGHIALASMVYQVRVSVAGGQEFTSGDEGKWWQIRFDARLEHYDGVLGEPSESRAPSKAEVRKGTPRDATETRERQTAARTGPGRAQETRKHR